jgi:Mor family transcriptional regulator
VTERELTALNRRSEVLYRYMRGDTVTSMAEHYKVSRNRIYELIRHAKYDGRSTRSAQMMLDETQRRIASDEVVSNESMSSL